MIFSSLLKYLHCFPSFCCIIALTLLEQCQIRKWSWDIVLSLVWKATLLVCHCSSIHLAPNGRNELMGYEADTSQLHCAKEAEEPSFMQETNLGGRAVPKASGFSRGPDCSITEAEHHIHMTSAYFRWVLEKGWG